jgi:hypothetical protein
MNETCVGGGARRLVDARFLRALNGNEKTELETHLAACSSCTERYRRLQLAERVASVGPERSFEEPSQLEIERIAGDLQLIESTADHFAWWRNMRGAFVGFSAAVAIAAAVAIFVVVKPPRETLTERGGTVQPSLSFAVYVINESGAIRAHTPGDPVQSKELLKLRASWDGVDPRHVAMAIVDAEGKVRVAQLGAPKGVSAGASIPGAVALAASAKGEALMYLVASQAAISDETLRSLVGARPEHEEVRRSLNAITVERRVLKIDP